MAGVAGILDKHNVEKKILHNMQNLLQHRGTANVDRYFFSVNSSEENKQYGGVVGGSYEDYFHIKILQIYQDIRAKKQYNLWQQELLLLHALQINLLFYFVISTSVFYFCLFNNFHSV